tara:strand:+ start:314 stop:718 length:405 start_codon:yes stop_codon:yes gene_type:complete
MNELTKTESSYKTIGEIAKELGLVNKNTGSLQTHTIRYWESQFKQIRPIVKAGNRRYYSKKNIENLKKIKYLLKDRGLTIKGVKKLLRETNINSLDDNMNLDVYKHHNNKKNIIKNKIKKISSIIKELKNIKNG